MRLKDAPFIEGINPSLPALMDDVSGRWVNYGDLLALANEWADRLSADKGLVFIYIDNSIQNVGALLGAWTAGHAVALFDPSLPVDARVNLESIYVPEFVIESDSRVTYRPGNGKSINSELALLLSTSGSTGSPKLVRLSHYAINTNAKGIAEVLHISAQDTAAGYLPLHYSYGLSVLLSHLISGARIRLSKMGLLDRNFWPAMREAQVSHFPGVPFHYDILLKLGLRRLNLPSLRVLTQAGGFLDVSLRESIHNYMEEIGGYFHVLYGQTEASPRMTTLHHNEFKDAPFSVGRPLPGCKIEISNSNGESGEIIFYGPNVMMGYGDSRDDLDRDDEQFGRLRTGDLGKLDESGRVIITGRAKRMGKISGLRINLDEVEKVVNDITRCAILQIRDLITIFVPSSGDSISNGRLKKEIINLLLAKYTLPITSCNIQFVDSIPMTSNGKINYPALELLI